MSEPDQDFSRDTLPWLRSGFDLEGYVGALAAWLIGILLGLLWSPLFWIGFVAAIIILFATRSARRTPPVGEDLIVAPGDGLVTAIGGATPPDELRLDGTGWVRLRISVAPTSTNGVYAPIDGAIDHVIRETGDPAAFAATKPDRPGLAVAYVSLVSGERAVGMRLATGGLGPRLELDSEPGDAVRMGRVIGTMRLGGWYDIYLPEGITPHVLPGQTLIGSETVIGVFEQDGQARRPAPAKQAETVEDPVNDIIEDIEDLADDGLNELSGTPEPNVDEPASEPETDDVSEMFARLRKEAQRVQDDD